MTLKRRGTPAWFSLGRAVFQKPVKRHWNTAVSGGVFFFSPPKLLFLTFFPFPLNLSSSASLSKPLPFLSSFSSFESLSKRKIPKKNRKIQKKKCHLLTSPFDPRLCRLSVRWVRPLSYYRVSASFFPSVLFSFLCCCLRPRLENCLWRCSGGSAVSPESVRAALFDLFVSVLWLAKTSVKRDLYWPVEIIYSPSVFSYRVRFFVWLCERALDQSIAHTFDLWLEHEKETYSLSPSCDSVVSQFPISPLYWYLLS